MGSADSADVGSEAVKRLVDRARLMDVRALSLKGEGDLSASDDTASTSSEEGLPVAFEASVGVRDDGRGLLATLACGLRAPADGAPAPVEMSVTMAAFYELSDWGPEPPSQDVLREFADKAAFYHLLPFVREGIVDLAARLRVPAPILPLHPRDLGPAEQNEE